MRSDPKNVIVIHCKGGKGRTGTIVCAWLLEVQMFQEAKDALKYFGNRRTDLEVGETFQGVETASQIRYVGYYGVIKQNFGGVSPPPRDMQITKVDITSIKGIGRGDGSDITMEIILHKRLVANYVFSDCQLSHDTTRNVITVNLQRCPTLSDDVKVRFTSTDKTLPRGYDDCPFYFWFNTRFVIGQRLVLTRAELDNPHKQKTWNIFQEDFSVCLTFAESI